MKTQYCIICDDYKEKIKFLVCSDCHKKEIDKVKLEVLNKLEKEFLISDLGVKVYTIRKERFLKFKQRQGEG